MVLQSRAWVAGPRNGFPVVKFLDLLEWAQSLRLASDSQLAEFGREVLDLIDLEPVALRFTELTEDLEKTFETKFDAKPEEEAWRWSEHIREVSAELDEMKEAKRHAYLVKLDRAEKVCRAGAASGLEYDL